MYNIFRILIEVPDYSSSFFFFFSKNEEEAISPGGKNCLGTTKGSTRMILVQVQKMYKTCYSSIYLGTTQGSTRMILVHVQKMYKTCYSGSFFFSKK